MTCPVCYAAWDDGQGTVCPQCQNDVEALRTKRPEKILAARMAFRDKTLAYAPESRVTRWDVAQPWIGLLLGALLLLFWMWASHHFEMIGLMRFFW